LLSKAGEATIGPNSIIHRREGFLDTLEDDSPVRIAFPLNIFQEYSADFNWKWLCPSTFNTYPIDQLQAVHPLDKKSRGIVLWVSQQFRPRIGIEPPS
jgi:hypothetical protein